MDRRIRSAGYLCILAIAISCLTLVAPPAAAAPADRAVARADSGELPALARGLAVGATLRIDGLPLDGVPGSASLELKRFEVFAADATIVASGGTAETTLPVPTDAYFHGFISADPASTVVVTVPATGRPRGLVTSPAGVWMIQGGRSGLTTRKVDVEHEISGPGFRCDTAPAADAAAEASSDGGTGEEAVTGSTTSVAHTARVAIDTDYEFFAKFGSTDAATSYVGDLFAYSSTVYEAEVGTSLLVSYLDLRTTSADPWTATDCSGALGELRSYWIGNHGNVDRSITHFLSGKSMGCGIAYVGVLCNTTYGYGVSASLRGDFDINSPSVVWDILVVSHEIGHNFNSPHTHCYNGIGGVGQPVDECYSGEGGCYAGVQSLPCAAGPGNGCGTIMSYCHLLSGGYGNITMTFGLGHPYGAAPDRVPVRMSDYVATRAASYPSCLAPVASGPLLSVNRAGTGSGTVTSDPLGVACGTDCSESYASGTVVVLTASPGAGSVFSGWTGDADCGDGTVTMDTDKSCTAVFNSTCGNGVREGAEQCDGNDLDGADCSGCAGTVACAADCTLDFSACTNGVCDGAETCGSCSADCVGTGATCGDGICQTADGEDCVTCPADCNGSQKGKKQSRFCCGNGGFNSVGCDASLCTQACVTTNAETCCGDGTCGGTESSFTCERDCGPPPVCGDGLCQSPESQCSCSTDCGAAPVVEGVCNDGIDNDCDGPSDCSDGDCALAAECNCKAVRDGCVSDTECCSGACKGKRGAKKCR